MARFRLLALLLFASFLLASFGLTRAHARAGGGDSYDGGSSGGGSSSSGSSDSGSSWSDSSSGSGGPSRPMSHDEGILFLLVTAIFMIVVVIGLTQGKRRSSVGPGLRPIQSLEAPDLEEAMRKLKERDPDFYSESFLARVQAAFFKVQDAWSGQDMTPVRAFLSDGVMERFRIQLESQKTEGLRNLMDQVQVLSARVVQAASDRHFDALHVRILASAVDSYVSLKDGSRVRGSGSSEQFAEVWSFLRRPGAKTLDKPGLIEGFCPNCGAALELADTAACGTCKSWVSSGEYDWVLAEITQECEWTPRNPLRQAPGWAALATADPVLNVQFLEDRASVVFWRWQAAHLRGEASLMRPVASDGFCERLAEDFKKGRVFHRDVGVGGVELLACGSDAGMDQAHVQVKWSGTAFKAEGGGATEAGRVLRREVFILGRKRGAATDPRSGLSSARCAGCGASPRAGDQPACEFCSAPFNDGSRHWVLLSWTRRELWRPPAPAPAPETAAPVPAAAADGDWSESLNPVDALAALVSAMMADREPDTREVEVLEAYAKRHAIPAKRVTDLFRAARAGQLDAPAPLSPRHGKSILEAMVRMCLADGKVSEAEMKGLVAYGARIQMTPEQVKGLVAGENGGAS